jgi:hypothetical protein
MKKKNALEQARSQLKKTDRVSAPKSIKEKLKTNKEKKS